MSSQIDCPNPDCGNKKNLSFKDCPTCKTFWWFPNVEKSNQKEELEALDKNYQRAVIEACKKGHESQLNGFQNALKESYVVVNMKEEELLEFLNDDNRQYKSHFMLVKEGIRSPYSLPAEEQRATVEAKLFGHYASEIRYGALTLDGFGLESYGNVAVNLKSKLLQDCTSFFVENSLIFMEKYKIEVLKPLPKGLSSSWGNRAKLSVAKVFNPQKSPPQTGDFAKLLLNSTGNKNKDEFIEAHIYGGFTNANFEFVRWQGKGSKVSVARGKKFEFLLKRKNIDWDNL